MIQGEAVVHDALEVDQFFAAHRLPHTPADFSYRDIIVASGPSDVGPDEVDLTSKFSRNVELKNPFVSAAMDSVTEWEMAATLARLGGLGVIHSALTPQEQKEQVRKVKYHLSARIDKPKTVWADENLEDIHERGDDFSTFPVLEREGGRVVGMITGSAFKYKRGALADIIAGDVMIPLDRLAKGTRKTTVEQAHALMRERMLGAVPLLRDNGRLAGMYTWNDVDAIVSGDAAVYTVDGRGRLRTAIAVSTRDKNVIDRIKLVRGNDNFLDVVVIDTSTGDNKYALDLLKVLKEENLGPDIVVGNMSEPRGAQILADHGADGIKVGQGPGSICTTRVQVGFGTPQATAIYNCSRAVAGMDVPVCADGGIEQLGDLSVAISVGADTIMMGGMFAATAQAPGIVYVNQEGVPVMGYRGMGSEAALRENASSRDRYSQKLGSVLLPEGVEKELPFKGDVVSIFQKCVTALRRGLSGSGSRSADYHREHARLRIMSPNAQAENRPHDVSA